MVEESEERRDKGETEGGSGGEKTEEREGRNRGGKWRSQKNALVQQSLLDGLHVALVHVIDHVQHRHGNFQLLVQCLP